MPQQSAEERHVRRASGPRTGFPQAPKRGRSPWEASRNAETMPMPRAMPLVFHGLKAGWGWSSLKLKGSKGAQSGRGMANHKRYNWMIIKVNVNISNPASNVWKRNDLPLASPNRSWSSKKKTKSVSFAKKVFHCLPTNQSTGMWWFSTESREDLAFIPSGGKGEEECPEAGHNASVNGYLPQTCTRAKPNGHATKALRLSNYSGEHPKNIAKHKDTSRFDPKSHVL